MATSGQSEANATHGPRRAVALVTLLLSACLAAWPAGASKSKKGKAVPLIVAGHETPARQLLDVGIQVLEHGLSSDEDALFELEKKGVYEDVRKSEARYIPVRLMDTLRLTGLWGAVGVVPEGLESLDVTVQGEIEESNGKRLILAVSAVDATGRVWLDKRYRQRADERAYRESKGDVFRQPFQNLYSRIANDLLAARRKLTDPEITEIRRVAALKFAADVAPVAFGDYLGTDQKGRTVVHRLPAAGDPMMARVNDVRERDHMLMETLTGHYTEFALRMDESYVDWRKFSYDEIRARNKARRQARTRQILGVVALLGGGLGDGSIFGGAMFLQGSAKSKVAKVHAEALRELAWSFDAEMEPLLVEIEGRTLRLTGSAEARYAAWRELLGKIFATETGLPADPDAAE